MFLIRFFKIITSKHAITELKFLCLPLKQNERVHSSQALNVGRSRVYTKPGLGHGLGHGPPCGLPYGLPYGPPQILFLTNNEEKNN